MPAETPSTPPSSSDAPSPPAGNGSPKHVSRRRATIAQVAAAAGVSAATVSGVLNNRADCYVAEATRRRVLEAADRLAYRPSVAARALMGKRTGTLGLLVPALDVEMTARKLAGFEAAARAKGQMTITACTGAHSRQEDEAIQWLIDRSVDAVAVYPTPEGPHDELRRLVDRGFPVVTFDAGDQLELACDDVSVDSYAGGLLEGRHLLELGRRRIVIAAGRRHSQITKEKIRGLDAALAEVGLPPAERMDLALERFSINHWDTHELTEQLEAFLRRRVHEFDAVAAVGDVLAMITVRLATQMGLRVPEDLAVIGYDGLALSDQGAVPLTTVCHSSERIGEQAFELLFERLAHRDAPESTAAPPPQRISVAPRVIPRGSTLGDAALPG